MNLSIEGTKLSLFIEKEAIIARVNIIASELYSCFSNETPVFLCVLKGAYVFVSDLLRAYQGECEIEFLRLSSYQGTESTGVVQLMTPMPSNLNGRHVIIVEDIVDTGISMNRLCHVIEKENPASVTVVTLFNKPSRRKCEVKVDYFGFEIPDKFIVGYGLDYDGLFRNLPDVYTK